MKKRKKRAKKGEPQRITKAVTHIRLGETNAGKLTALDALAPVYLQLVQQYVTLFCTDEVPESFHAPYFPTTLSERWQRVAIQQGAGIAQSWRTNRANAYQDYLDALAEYKEQETDGSLEEGQKEPNGTNGTFPSSSRHASRRTAMSSSWNPPLTPVSITGSRSARLTKAIPS